MRVGVTADTQMAHAMRGDTARSRECDETTTVLRGQEIGARANRWEEAGVLHSLFECVEPVRHVRVHLLRGLGEPGRVSDSSRAASFRVTNGSWGNVCFTWDSK